MIPFIRPNPPKLSKLVAQLQQIENSGLFTNFGPVNQLFEKRVIDEQFGGAGHALTVCNATIGLMVAIKAATEAQEKRRGDLVLVPAFTFAATAHAAAWCGLTPVFYDIDPETWLPSKGEEHRLLGLYGDQIAAVVPYATFGNALDVGHYEALQRTYGVAVVMDCAASLGSRDDMTGACQGAGSPIPSVFSMHATKTFSTSEAGLIYSADRSLIERLRHMCNFGFEKPREASGLGLNAKLGEIGALLAVEKLNEIDRVVAARVRLYELYKTLLPRLTFQRRTTSTIAHQFVPCLLPEELQHARATIIETMAKRGIQLAKYFSPHLAQQEFFRRIGRLEPLPETDSISNRALSVPLSDGMTEAEVMQVCTTLNEVIDHGSN